MKKVDWYSKVQKAGKGILASQLESTTKRLLPLPSPSLNWALSGGLAFGKIVTVYGPEQAGKTLIAQLAIKELHKSDKDAWAIWYDAEFSFDPDYAKKLGIDLDRLMLFQTNKPSEIFDHFYDTIWPMIQEGFPCKIMVIDSIKSIRGPKETVTGSVEDHVIGDLSQLLNKAFRKIIEPIRKENILTFCVQQVNAEMDMFKQKRGIKYHLPSGFSLRHFSDYIILLEKIESKASKLFDDTHKNIRKQPLQVGHTVRCKIEKSRCGTPGLTAEFRLKYGVGIVDQALEVATLAIELGIVTKPSIVSYAFQDVKVQGVKNFVDAVEQRPELYRALLKAIGEFDIWQLSDNSNVGAPAAEELDVKPSVAPEPTNEGE